MISGGADGSAPGDRRRIEEVVALLLGEAPAGWAHLHLEFDSATSAVTTSLTTGEGTSIPLPVPAGVIAALSDYHRQSGTAGRLVIDCDADGRLSARTDPVATAAGSRRWPQWVLATITIGCLAAAAVVFATGWRWSEPPRLTALGVPPPPRAQQAFAVATQWYEAENNGDVARMRELACVHPAQSVTDWISTIGYYGQDQGLVFTDAVTKFRDDGAAVWVRIAVRIRPVDDRTKREVDEAQTHGGFLYEEMTLASEGGTLKVCDIALPPKAGG